MCGKFKRLEITSSRDKWATNISVDIDVEEMEIVPP